MSPHESIEWLGELAYDGGSLWQRGEMAEVLNEPPRKY